MNARAADPVIARETVSDDLLTELKDLYPGQVHKEAIWRWQFGTRMGRDCLFITARDAGRLIGFNALMPVRLWSQGEEVDAWWSCDFIVTPAYQGQGIGSQIKDRMLNWIHEPILSMGISSNAWPILLNKGWCPGPQLPLYERVYRPWLKRQWLLKFWAEMLSGIQRALRSTRRQRLRFESVPELPEKSLVNELWETVRPEQGTSVVKNYGYLFWRYERFPFRTYQYLLIRDAQGTLRGLVVYRVDIEGRVEVSDYLGPEFVPELLVGLSDAFKLLGVTAVFWRIEAPGAFWPLIFCGFIKKPYATRFVYLPWGKEPYGLQWNLSSGDSDGDFLSAARDCFSKVTDFSQREERYRIHRITEEELKYSQKLWDGLLKQSTANPLFMSWHWQSSWWAVWGNRLNLNLHCFFIYQADRLVGIVPLFRIQRSWFGPSEYQFLGNAWRIAPSVRSEYIEPILEKNHVASLYDFLQSCISRGPFWSRLIVPDHVGPIKTWRQALVRQRDRGYRIETQGELGDYLNSLGKNTRLRAFNRMSYLIKTYPSAQWGRFGCSHEELKNFFGQLNDFHRARWGRPCFLPEAVEFHCRLIKSAGKEIKPLLHYLEVEGQIRSLSYNLLVGNTMYNIQSGFQAGFDRKISLGTLHFGKLISLCFSDKGIHALDLLAGRGKKTDYKNHFRGDTVEFNTLELFPAKTLLIFTKIKKRSIEALRPKGYEFD